MRLSRFIGLAALVGAVLATSIQRVAAAPIIHLPFPAGVAVSIIQGYNGGTHQGVERYSLDLTRDDGKTSGSPALAPAPGVVAWSQPPGDQHGCISIQLDNGGGLYTMLCHLLLNRPYNNGDHIAAGQQIGTVAPPGMVGNNGVAHIHLQLYRVVGGDRSPVPFSPPDGLPLEGISLPPGTGYNQWLCNGSGPGCHMLSQNGPGAPTTTTTTGGTPGPTRSATPPAIVGAGASSSGAASLARVPAQSLAIGQQVQVIGTGDCLRVHTSPALAANVVYCLPDGAQSVITDGPQVADGYTWWKLSSLGWAVADFLAAVDGSSVVATPPASSPTPTPQPAAPAQPSTPPPTPPAASATPALPTGFSFAQGDTVVVAGTGDCLNVRSDPGLSSQVLTCIPDGTQGTISDGPVQQDGLTWYRLLNLGWVDAEYLQSAQ